ncbi:energy transducer TonB [Flavobacteriaceae bacterium]|nr:energy transducer TonB [Flavobacteriaceae bacterium]
MKYFRTKQERNSARLTALIAILLILLLFVVGPPYMDPPEEYGVAVNFGTTDFGSGTNQPKTPTTNNTKKTPEPTAAEVPAISKPSTSNSEEVLTTDDDAAMAIKKAAQEAAKIKAEADRIRKENEAKERKKKALDALMGGIGADAGTASGSEGNDEKVGDKGQLNGDPYAPSYFGNSGRGNGGVGYGLNGRGTPSKSKVIPDCDEEGRVVVEIHVNQSGEVTRAIPGKRGTTGDLCLYEAAKKTALTHKWPADFKAPIKQIGFVIVEFSVRQ